MADIVRVALKIDTHGKEKLAQVSNGLGRVDRAATKTSNSLKKMAGILAGAYGVRQLVRGLHSIAEATMAGEKSAAKLNAVLRATGGVAGVTARQVEELSAALARNTLFNDDEIRNMSAQLLTFKNISSSVFNETAEAVLNMASVMDQDLRSTAIQLGKALNDPLTQMTALRRIGVSFSEAQVDMVRRMMQMNDVAGAQRVILDELNSEFGGVARELNSGVAGGLANVTKGFIDLQEAIGRALEKGTGFVSYLDQLAEGLRGIAFMLSADTFDEWLKTNQKIVDLQEQLASGRARRVAGTGATTWLSNALLGDAPLTPDAIARINAELTDLNTTLLILQNRMGGRPTNAPPPGALPAATRAPISFEPRVIPIARGIEAARGPMAGARDWGKWTRLDEFQRVVGRSSEAMKNLEKMTLPVGRLVTASDEAASKLQTVAIASLHAAAGLGHIIRQGGGFGAVLGGLLGVAGGIVGAVNPLAGAAMMAGGSLLSGLSARDNKPVPVSVERYGTTAITQRRDEDTMIQATIIIEQGGVEIKRIQRVLRRMELRDGIPRLAF